MTRKLTENLSKILDLSVMFYVLSEISVSKPVNFFLGGGM